MFEKLKTVFVIVCLTTIGAAAVLLAPLLLSLGTAFIIGYILWAVFMNSSEGT